MSTARRRHGHASNASRSPEYDIWCGIKSRCHTQSATGYDRYGALGIVVCAGWRHNFVAFYADMGPRPSDDHEIDRIDGACNYSCGHCEECVANNWPANCRWLTKPQQARNRRSNRMITANGETLCLADWAKKMGVSFGMMLARVRRGWTPEDVVSKPKIPLCESNNHLIAYGGETLSIADWSRKTGIDSKTIAKRLQAGWTTERCLTQPTRIYRRR